MPCCDDDADYSRQDNGGDSHNHYDNDDHYDCDYYYDCDDEGERRRRSVMIKVMTPVLHATIG